MYLENKYEIFCFAHPGYTPPKKKKQNKTKQNKTKQKKKNSANASLC